MKHAVVDFSKLRFLSLKFEKIPSYFAGRSSKSTSGKAKFYNKKRKKEKKEK